MVCTVEVVFNHSRIEKQLHKKEKEIKLLSFLYNVYVAKHFSYKELD